MVMIVWQVLFAQNCYLLRICLLWIHVNWESWWLGRNSNWAPPDWCLLGVTLCQANGSRRFEWTYCLYHTSSKETVLLLRNVGNDWLNNRASYPTIPSFSVTQHHRCENLQSHKNRRAFTRPQHLSEKKCRMTRRFYWWRVMTNRLYARLEITV
jgi:hypothetical protein